MVCIVESAVQSQAEVIVGSTGKPEIRVLQVDDDPSFLEVSKRILMMDGNLEIDYVLCVDEAFQKLATGNYDVIISDYDMPQKDGLQFLKDLREQKNEIPFMIFTGKGREEVATHALNLEADHYVNKYGLQKPFMVSYHTPFAHRRKNAGTLIYSEDGTYGVELIG